MAVVINLILQGKNKKEILEEVTENNLFQLRSPLSIKNRFNMV
ncbi:BrxA family protein [Herbaspirillum sp. VT-16-41]